MIYRVLKMKYVAVFLVVAALRYSDAAKILGIFPIPSFSHQQPLLVLSYELGKRGHNLTILTTNPSKVPIKNVTEIDFSALYADWVEMQKTVMSLQTRLTGFKVISDACEWSKQSINNIYEKPQWKKFIRDVNGTKFDLILYESVTYSSLLGIRELIGNPPVIGLVTLHPLFFTDDIMGNPLIPSYIPNVLFNHGDRMNIWDRLSNTIGEAYGRYVMHSCIYPMQDEILRREFGKTGRTAMELENDISLLIAMVDLATGYPKPLQPNTVYVGPLHLKKPAPLPQDIQKWMDGAEEGVIYFSLGSNMKGTSVDEEKRSAFIKAFKQFPKTRVLWKWESDTRLPGQPANVLVKKWLPQISVLAHPKLKLFISQCGLQSFQESIDSGIPILGVPMFGDQEFNAKKLVTSGAGLSVEFNEITYDEVYEKLNDLLTKKSYKENMMRLSSITKDKPTPAMDTAIWWVEYVLRHNGAPHLRPAVLDMSWYQYYFLDILLVIVITFSIIIYVIYCTIKRFIALYYSLNTNKKEKLKKN